MDAAYGRPRLANLTVTDQRPYVEQYRAQGFDVEPDPAGLTVPVGLAAAEIRRLAEETAQRVVAEGFHGAIIGGRADAVCYLRDALAAVGLGCYAADTARVLDREGYFVAMPVGLIEVLPPPSGAGARNG